MGAFLLYIMSIEQEEVIICQTFTLTLIDYSNKHYNYTMKSTIIILFVLSVYGYPSGIAFVVDSADHSSLDDAKDFLFKVMSLPGLPRSLPVVVFANKQELPG